MTTYNPALRPATKSERGLAGGPLRPDHHYLRHGARSDIRHGYVSGVTGVSRTGTDRRAGVCKRGLMTHVIRSRCQAAGKQLSRAAGRPISGPYAW